MHRVTSPKRPRRCTSSSRPTHGIRRRRRCLGLRRWRDKAMRPIAQGPMPPWKGRSALPSISGDAKLIVDRCAPFLRTESEALGGAPSVSGPRGRSALAKPLSMTRVDGLRDGALADLADGLGGLVEGAAHHLGGIRSGPCCSLPEQTSTLGLTCKWHPRPPD